MLHSQTSAYEYELYFCFTVWCRQACRTWCHSTGRKTSLNRANKMSGGNYGAESSSLCRTEASAALWKSIYPLPPFCMWSGVGPSSIRYFTQLIIILIYLIFIICSGQQRHLATEWVWCLTQTFVLLNMIKPERKHIIINTKLSVQRDRT